MNKVFFVLASSCYGWGLIGLCVASIFDSTKAADFAALSVFCGGCCLIGWVATGGTDR